MGVLASPSSETVRNDSVMDSGEVQLIVRRFGAFVFNRVHERIFDKQAVEEVVDDVFFEFSRLPVRPHDDTGIYKMLVIISKQKSIDRLRKDVCLMRDSRRNTPLNGLDVPSRTGCHFEEVDLRDYIDREVAPEDRLILQLLLDGNTVEEIMRIVHKTYREVKAVRARIRKKLSNFFDR